MIVDIGGGTLPHPQATYVIDLHHPRLSPKQDATMTPWMVDGDRDFIGDGTVDMIWASHVLEHITKGDPLIRLMNECWRILRPGGRLHITMPVVGWTDPNDGTPHSREIGWQPWADPTHVAYWWAPESLLYFCEGHYRPHADYGVSCWAALGPNLPDPHGCPVGGWFIRNGWELVAAMVKP